MRALIYEVNERRSRWFAGSNTAPALGRDFVNGVLSDWGIEEEFRDVALVTAELVANAVRHAGGSLTLAVALIPDRVRIEVADGSRQQPVSEPLTSIVRGAGDC